MKKKKHPKVLVLGNFGYANHDLSGQTIKTRVTRELLEKYYVDGVVDYFDTQILVNKKNIFTLLNKVCCCDRLIYLPAHGNLKYLFPIYFILSHLFHFDIIYSVIGGWLVPYLKSKPLHRWMLKRIKVVLAETSKMKEDLISEYLFNNVDVLYNFRFIDHMPKIRNHKELKLVFMARIDPNKGLDTIFAMSDYINNIVPKPNITIDFYGPFSPNITQDEFMSNISKYDFVYYHGALEPEDIHKVICDYDLLLFPTHYYTEGLPGTIIDSYLAGLPPIVSNWMHAHEFVDDGNSGLILPFNNHQEAYNETILNLYKNRGKLDQLKKGAIDFGRKYTSEYAWNRIKKYI